MQDEALYLIVVKFFPFIRIEVDDNAEKPIHDLITLGFVNGFLNRKYFFTLEFEAEIKRY